jgi:hypothetical protein
MRPWGRPSRPIRRLVLLARKIVDFHETEPLLAGEPRPCRASQVNDHPSEKMNTPKIEKRTDSVQFWTDSNASNNLWSRQADEPAADYQVFVAWLQRPAPRFFRQSADALHCSASRLRRLSVRHRWKTRAAAFDNHRADAASEALNASLHAESVDWQQRAERAREESWVLHQQMVDAARVAIHEFQKHPRRATLTELARMFDLASVLGRRACGLPLEHAPVKEEETTVPVRPDFEESLRRVYGPPEENSDSQQIRTPLN